MSEPRIIPVGDEILESLLSLSQVDVKSILGNSQGTPSAPPHYKISRCGLLAAVFSESTECRRGESYHVYMRNKYDLLSIPCFVLGLQIYTRFENRMLRITNIQKYYKEVLTFSLNNGCLCLIILIGFFFISYYLIC